MKERESSSTALLIARATLLMEGLPEFRNALLPGSAEWSRSWLSEAGGGAWFNWSLKRAWARRFLFQLQQFLVPGLFLHFLTRKRLLEKWVRDGISKNCRQVVIIGAGLDSLAWRLKPEFPDVEWFELDHPDTQQIKRRALTADTSQTGVPHLLALDLRRETPDAVLARSPAFDPALPTFYVAEGLFMYLPGGRVAETVSRLAGFSAPGSRLAFTFMEHQEGERLAFRHGHRLIDSWLRWRQEPFQWGVKGDVKASLEALAAESGWQFFRSVSSAGMRSEILAPLGLEKEVLAEGESVALFMKSRIY